MKNLDSHLLISWFTKLPMWLLTPPTEKIVIQFLFFFLKNRQDFFKTDQRWELKIILLDTLKNNEATKVLRTNLKLIDSS